MLEERGGRCWRAPCPGTKPFWLPRPGVEAERDACPCCGRRRCWWCPPLHFFVLLLQGPPCSQQVRMSRGVPVPWGHHPCIRPSPFGEQGKHRSTSLPAAPCDPRAAAAYLARGQCSTWLSEACDPPPPSFNPFTASCLPLAPTPSLFHPTFPQGHPASASGPLAAMMKMDV